MTDIERRRALRSARLRRVRRRRAAARVLEILHKLVTGGAALAALLRGLF